MADMTAQGPMPTHLRVGLVFVTSVGAAVLIGICAIHEALPYNPVPLPLAKHLEWKLWLPEGWKFFTRDPQEERPLLFRRMEDGTWHRAERGVNASPSNLFGLSRKARAQGVELGLITQRSRLAASLVCDEGYGECLRKLGEAEPAMNVRNISPSPSLCGDIIIMFQKPLPWAWARSVGRREMPARGYRLRIEC